MAKFKKNKRFDNLHDKKMFDQFQNTDSIISGVLDNYIYASFSNNSVGVYDVSALEASLFKDETKGYQKHYDGFSEVKVHSSGFDKIKCFNRVKRMNLFTYSLIIELINLNTIHSENEDVMKLKSNL